MNVKNISTATAALISVALAGPVLAQESMVMAPQGSDASLNGYYRFGLSSTGDRQHDLSPEAKRALRERGFITQDFRHFGDSELAIDFSRASDSGLEYGIHTDLNLVHKGFSTANNGGDQQNDVEEAWGYITTPSHGTFLFGNTDHVANDFQTRLGAEGSYGQNDHFHHPALVVVDNNVFYVNRVDLDPGATITIPDLNATPTIDAVNARTILGDGVHFDLLAQPFVGIDHSDSVNGFGSKVAYYSPDFNGWQFAYSWEDSGDLEGDASIGASYTTDILRQADLTLRYGYLDFATQGSVGAITGFNDATDPANINNQGQLSGPSFSTHQTADSEVYTYGVEFKLDDLTLTAAHLQSDSRSTLSIGGLAGQVRPIQVSNGRILMNPQTGSVGTGGPGTIFALDQGTASEGIFTPTNTLASSSIRADSAGIGYQVNSRLWIGYYHSKSEASFPTRRDYRGGVVERGNATPQATTLTQKIAEGSAEVVDGFSTYTTNFQKADYGSLSASYLITDGVLLSISYNRFDIEQRQVQGNFLNTLCADSGFFTEDTGNPQGRFRTLFDPACADASGNFDPNRRITSNPQEVRSDLFSNDGEEVNAVLHVAF